MDAGRREGWGTKAGFILAAVGSAVGLGNMWRFAYVASDRGGAAFVILYVIMVFAIGVPVMMAEFAVGRRAGLSPIGALRDVAGQRWVPLGYMYVAAGFLILSYYSVIAGWATRYMLEAMIGGFTMDPATYFERSSTGVGAVLYHVFFMALTISIVAGGIKLGIERASFVLMPLLFILLIALAIWAAFLKGAGEGYSFYLRPHVERVFSVDTLSGAAGQAFFSLSLGMGAMLTYASYLSRDANLPGSAATICFSDFAVAFLAGLVVFPVVFAFGLQGEIGASSVGALFISLPRAFVAMGAAGRVIGLIFFVALVIGALTSAISLLEVVVSSLIDNWKIDRARAALGAGLVIMLLGIPSAMSLEVLGVFDKIAGEFLLVVGAFCLSIFVGWRMSDPLAELSAGFGSRRPLRGWLWTIRIVVPIVLTAVIYQVGKSSVALIIATFF